MDVGLIGLGRMGGNTHYQDDVRRAPGLVARGLRYVDTGVSGGIWGLTEGYRPMVGGERDVVQRLAPIFENSFADRLLAALRNAFGGHAVRR